ncbi:MAG: capsid assembly protein [Roseomonas sp.]
MPEDLLANALADQATPATRPQDVPEKFWDQETGMLRVDALLKSYRELERRLSQRIAPPNTDASEEEVQRFRRSLGVPDSPDEYQITPKHDLCCADADVNKRLHEAGFTPTQAQLVYDLAAERLLPMIAEAAAQFEADRQVEKLRDHFGGAERFRRIAQQLSAWGRANLPDAVFEALSTTSEGVMALYRMMEKGEPAITRKAHAATQTDEVALREMMRDPRYWRTREPEFVKRVTDGFRRMVGG